MAPDGTVASLRLGSLPTECAENTSPARGFESSELDLSIYRVKNHKVAPPEAKSRMGCDLCTHLTREEWDR